MKRVWSVLQEIKNDFRHFDDKWEQHIQNAATDRAKLSQLCRQTEHIERLLTRGNGQKSVLVQLEGLHNDVETLKDDHKALKAASGIADSTPEEDMVAVKKAKWVAIAKIAGLVTLALPGILALFGAGG